MPTRNVNLSDQQSRFIKKTVHGGRFRNASEVVRAGLRLLEQQEKENVVKLQRLKRQEEEAHAQIERGEFVEIGLDQLDEFLDGIDARVRGRKNR